MPCYFRLRTVVLAAWIGVFATGPALAVTWDMYIYNAVASIPSVRDTQKMIDRIDAETNHALQIRLHLGGSLQINVTTITQAVGDGIVQMADDSFFAGSIPIGDLSRLPFLVSSQDEYGKIEPIVSRYMEAGYAKRGIVMLGAYVYPVQVAFARKKLTSLADMKGLKMRVTSPEQGEFVKRFGGIPITMGTPEVPAALDRGVIDGAFTASAGAGYPWKDLLKYNYRIGVNYVTSYIIVNKAAFDALPADIQPIVRRVVAESMPGYVSDMQAEEAKLTQKMADGGIVVTPAAQEDVVEATRRMASFWDDWAHAHGPDGIAGLAAIRAAIGR